MRERIGFYSEAAVFVRLFCPRLCLQNSLAKPDYFGIANAQRLRPRGNDSYFFCPLTSHVVLQ
jgi:hypothetical protein